MNEFFIRLLNMSLTGSVVILGVMLLRLCLRRAPKIISYYLWAVVLFRLLCPVSFSLPVSLLGVLQAPAAEQGTVTYIPEDIIWSEKPALEQTLPVQINHVSNTSLTSTEAGKEQMFVEGAESVGNASASPTEGTFSVKEMSLMERIISGAAFVWAVGMGLMLIYSGVSLMMLLRRLKQTSRREGEVFYSQGLETPFVLGLVRPRIYLPKGLAEEEKSYILLHEQFHIQRFDHIVKMISWLTLCLHWFNPLVWAAFFLSGRDMEMACDEAVLRRLGSEAKQQYSASLLNLATGRRILGGVPLAFGEGDTGSRIRNILKYKKPRVVLVCVAVVAAVAAAVLLLANPGSSAEEPQPGTDAGPESQEELELTQGAPREIEITLPEVGPNIILGADGPILDYADQDLIIFHGYFGLFVYSEKAGQLIGQVDLKAIGCDATQGDMYCEVSVAADGSNVYLYPTGYDSLDMYRYDVKENRLYVQNYDLKDIELFESRQLSWDVMTVDSFGYGGISLHCVPFEQDGRVVYGYLASAGGVMGDLVYVKGHRYTALLSGSGVAEFSSDSPIVTFNDVQCDITESCSEVNAVIQIFAAPGYWIVEGHINPDHSWYGFFNAETARWDTEFIADHITYTIANSTVARVPFDLGSVVYTSDGSLYACDGQMLMDLELEQTEYVRNIFRDDLTVTVEICDSETEAERMMTFHIDSGYSLAKAAEVARLKRVAEAARLQLMVRGEPLTWDKLKELQGQVQNEIDRLELYAGYDNVIWGDSEDYNHLKYSLIDEASGEEYQLWIDYATDTNIVSDVMLTRKRDSVSFLLYRAYNKYSGSFYRQPEEIDEFLGNIPALSDWVMEYTLPSEWLVPCGFQAYIGDYGGEWFQLSRSMPQWEWEERYGRLDDWGPPEWHVDGAILRLDGERFFFEDGNLTEVSLLYNHSGIMESEPVSGCQEQAMLLRMYCELYTLTELDEAEKSGNPIPEEEQYTEIWYVCMGREGAPYGYAATLNGRWYTKEEVIEFARSIQFAEGAFTEE